MPDLVRTILPTPVGTLTLVAGDAGLVAILWPDERAGRVVLPPARDGAHPHLEAAATQIGGYFAGTRRSFDLALACAGTPFQRMVWDALARIPFGETRGYAEVADMIGQPSAVRAVAAANGRNPLSIVVPCHRVIGTNGALTGFAGGLEAKRRLLVHEGALLA